MKHYLAAPFLLVGLAVSLTVCAEPIPLDRYAVETTAAPTALNGSASSAANETVAPMAAVTMAPASGVGAMVDPTTDSILLPDPIDPTTTVAPSTPAATLVSEEETVSAGASVAAEPILQAFHIQNSRQLPLAPIAGGSQASFELGIGSGLFHLPQDGAKLVYVVTDRGPQQKCDKMSERLQLPQGLLCPQDESDKIGFVPMIYKLEIGSNGTAEIIEATPLQLTIGSPVEGFINLWRIPKDEAKAAKASQDFDIEALVQLPDGTFWLADEGLPSLVQVSSDGRILQRVVPPSALSGLSGASYPVVAGLPDVLQQQRNNKGIESLALSADARFLYFVTQAPLAYPSEKATKDSQLLRVYQFDWQQRQVTGVFVYLLDAAATYSSKQQDSIYVNEITAAADGTLLILEGLNDHKRIYTVNLSQATLLSPEQVENLALEAMSAEELAAQQIPLLAKQLLVDLAPHRSAVSNIEGLVLSDPTTLILVNDTDFGNEKITRPLVQIRLVE